jgi:hypothetical protein
MPMRAIPSKLGAMHTPQTGDVLKTALQVLLVAAFSAGLFWLIWIYASGLRDPRYLDGWILAGVMGFQLAYHIARKVGLSPKANLQWRRLHIVAGYMAVAAFLSHCDFALPETGLEWALWSGFVLVTLTGVAGTYLVWSLQAKRPIPETLTFARIPARRAELELAYQVAATQKASASTSIDLPGLPYDAWIEDLCVNQLNAFFGGHRNFVAHLTGSQRPLQQLTDAIDQLSRYVDHEGKSKLDAIKDLVIEKDRLDFAQVSLGLTKGWLFIHVPVTYALFVLTVAHGIIVYAFASGVW